MSDILKSARDRLNENLMEIKQAYVNFVSQNPEMVDQIEKTVKTSSYLFEALSKNYDNSIFISELITSACNLFAYANTKILLKTRNLISQTDENKFVAKLKQALTVVEFSQAFLELSAGRLGGSGARWAVIVVITIIKTILRCLLLYMFDSGLQSPALVTMINKTNIATQATNSDENENIYIGRRTGHQMATLSSSYSKWENPKPENMNCWNLYPSTLNKREKIGECLHIIRPMLHLLSTGVFGTKSLLPWLAALVVDTSSHALIQRDHKSERPYNPQEKQELRRRYANLIVYLLRSPVYEKTTGPRIHKILHYLSEHLPLAHYVVQPLSKYLPAWQRVYFYTWSD
nr:peroxisomal membrane protein PEX16 [Ciona intestinalis]|eukprot:XP_002131520.1 peroxisomal membrane protein PEX16 [Ciona intestinalis]